MVKNNNKTQEEPLDKLCDTLLHNIVSGQMRIKNIGHIGGNRVDQIYKN